MLVHEVVAVEPRPLPPLDLEAYTPCYLKAPVISERKQLERVVEKASRTRRRNAR